MGKGKSLISFTVLARIQAMISTANGAFSLPEREPGKEYEDKQAYAKGRFGDYVQGLFNKTPPNAKLEVLAIKKEHDGSKIAMIISNAKGQTIKEFTIKGELTEENAGPTGESIAKVLDSPHDAGVCGRRLLALARSPQEETVVFHLVDDGQQNRLQIENREDGA